ncbi:TetR family transcriptional regulator [Phycicoccus endophyticus]|uniref:TetR family transcriptional regulator n=1 Tax=Phycicoccus endophyticus TaxID=1690220 RepID=A0A7G9R2I7_9MICO|nr:TetR/AcrR family transcriptional regulator [Phycicoccus endophyticus]NHI20730.1 TetR family transcriptional regulator [Phycicoccus endophyticus]QNN49812.1 TetR family transcriptional regulator [Phycicoccus endophyticus]GGL35322.1 TetR family transcriptional regulator [Phycicoccus endophyticus]
MASTATGGLPEASLRERKKATTRANLHLAAVRLALERGTEAMTVEEVAAAAGVSPRTFFNYYETKEDALVGADPGRAGRVREAVLARPSGEPVDRAVRTVLLEHVRGLEADPQLWRMRRELAARSPALAARIAGAGDQLETVLVEAAYGRTGSDPALDLETGLTARVAMAAVRAAFHQHRAAGFVGSLAARAEAALDAVGVGSAG